MIDGGMVGNLLHTAFQRCDDDALDCFESLLVGHLRLQCCYHVDSNDMNPSTGFALQLYNHVVVDGPLALFRGNARRLQWCQVDLNIPSCVSAIPVRCCRVRGVD